MSPSSSDVDGLYTQWAVERYADDDGRGQPSTFVRVPDCLDDVELRQILSLRDLLRPEWIMHDRAAETEYHHVVHRVEPLLREQLSEIEMNTPDEICARTHTHRRLAVKVSLLFFLSSFTSHNVHALLLLTRRYQTLYEALIGKMLTVDTEIWRITENVTKVYPEIEFIRYDRHEGDGVVGDRRPPKMGFASHVDNGSVLTAVYMLSDPDTDYRGGSLEFVQHAALNDETDGPGRPALLERGQCAVFRGDQLSHWVTPITRGTRMVLQIELHLALGDRGTDDDDDDDDEDDEEEEDDDEDDVPDEHDLERTGKFYNLPLPSERKDDATMDPSNWIVNEVARDSSGSPSTFVKVPNCLSPAQWSALLFSLQSYLRSDLISDDRHAETEFFHTVHRVEHILKNEFAATGLYEALIGKMLRVDGETWHVLDDDRRVTAVYPEIEFIEYNHTIEGQPPKMGFASHVDNGSALTAVFMLSDPSSEYEGGALMFAKNAVSDVQHGDARPADFAIRDCAVFRGDSLSHWVTPVTKGSRKVLQIELHLQFGDRGDDDEEDDEDEWEDDEEWDEEEDYDEEEGEWDDGEWDDEEWDEEEWDDDEWDDDEWDEYEEE